MHKIYYFSDGVDYLKEAGIRQLTSEACAVSMRMLCDVTQEGKELLENYFSANLTLNDSMNGRGAVGSILLDHEMFTRLFLYKLLLEHPIVTKVTLSDDYYENDAYICFDSFPERDGFAKEHRFMFEGPNRTYYRPGASQPHDSSILRNVHAFTGRVV